MNNTQKILGLILLLACASVMAEQAGTARFVLGKVVAKTNDGNERRLARSLPIFSGEIIETTERGRAQLQFEDGSFVSLQPGTEFKVDSYRYLPGQKDGNNLALSLAKGGMRMVTGAIGKTEPRAVLIKTTVATIGIRGTGFTLQNCSNDCSAKESGNKVPDGLYAFVTDGRIILNNAAGELEAAKGFGVYVSDAYTAPVFTPVQPMALPPGSAEKTSDETAGDSNASAEQTETAQITAEPEADVGYVDAKSAGNLDKTDIAPVYQAGEQVTADGVTTALPVGGINLNLTFP